MKTAITIGSRVILGLLATAFALFIARTLDDIRYEATWRNTHPPLERRY